MQGPRRAAALPRAPAIILPALAFRTALPARPPWIAATTTAGSRPDRTAKTSASPTAWMFAATIIWFASFTVLPAPVGPQRTALLPRTSNTGPSAWKAASSPPAMIASSPAMAPGSPPLTGASTKATPRSLAAAAIFRETPGSIEDMSVTSAGSSGAARTPPGPSITSSESGESGSIRMTASRPLAHSAPDPARRAPAATSSSTGPGERLWTVTSKPAASRFFAMGFPMTPRPMNPIVLSDMMDRGYHRNGAPPAAPNAFGAAALALRMTTQESIGDVG